MKKIFYLMLVMALFSCTSNDPAIDPAVSNFSFNLVGNFAPCKISFTNTSLNATSYYWDFGDGSISIEKSPTHIYSNGGTYNVTLTTNNDAFRPNILNKTITIANTPTKLKINSIVLISAPFINQNTGASWNIGTGPNFCFVISGGSPNYTSIFESSIYSGVLQSNLPLTYNTGFPCTITELTYQYYVWLFNYKSTNSGDIIDLYYLKGSDFAPVDGSQYPTVLNFSSTLNTKSNYQFNVEWLQ